MISVDPYIKNVLEQEVNFNTKDNWLLLGNKSNNDLIAIKLDQCSLYFGTTPPIAHYMYMGREKGSLKHFIEMLEATSPLEMFYEYVLLNDKLYYIQGGRIEPCSEKDPKFAHSIYGRVLQLPRTDLNKHWIITYYK